MIGRYTREGVLAHVGPAKLAQVGLAGALIVGAAVVHYGSDLPGWVTPALCLASLALTGLPIVWGALAGLVRLRTNVDELVSIAIVASVVLGEWITAAIVAFIMVLGGLIEELTSERAVTMLIVGCPCAFVLATPTAVVAALGRASRQGILIKGGRFLEAAAQVRALAFDKTGTLTTGEAAVARVIPLDGLSADQVLAAAARLEGGSEHPVARAIVAEAKGRGLAVDGAPAIERIPGLGVTERDAESPWRVGNLRLMEQAGVQSLQAAEEDVATATASGMTPVYVAEGEHLRGVIALQDQARPEAADALRGLEALALEPPLMLTGDLPAAATTLAERVGIPADRVRAQLLPEDKFALLRDLEQEGRRVCYVGDGTNDGPALAVASVGVSIGSRQDTVALETADAVLMRGDLSGLPFLLRLGRATARTIHQNLILFGLLFNASMLALSATGLLTPILGAIGHNLGSVAVVLNSARLLRFR